MRKALDWWSPPRPRRPRDVPVPAGIGPDVRTKILNRMIALNAGHARTATDYVGTRDAASPYGLVLLSITPRGKYHDVGAAYRIDVDLDDDGTLPEKLTGLIEVARARITDAHRDDRQWDPRTPGTGLVIGGDEATDRSTLIGVGVTSLDTPEYRWQEAKYEIRARVRENPVAGTEVGGVALILLADGTAIRVLRRGRVSQHEIFANRRLDWYGLRVHLDETLGRDDPVWPLLDVLLKNLRCALDQA